MEIESQFTTHTYTLNNGRIQYSKGNDHFIDAVRCALIMRERRMGGDEWDKSSGNLPIPVVTDPVFI